MRRLELCFVDPYGFWIFGLFIEQRGGAGGHRGGHPSGTSSAQVVPSGPKKSPKGFAAFGLRLVLIFCEVKNKQKTIGTGHYVNMLVPKK